MKRAFKIGILIMPLFGWSCAVLGQSTYTQDMVQEASFTDTLLEISVLSETAYYFAGANVLSRADQNVVLELVRCKLKKKCNVDIPANYNRDTGFHELRIEDKTVKLDFGKNGSLIVPKSN